MKGQIQQNRADLLNKIATLDMMLESLNKVHNDDATKQEELVKKISTRKLILMDELYNLLSNLAI